MKTSKNPEPRNYFQEHILEAIETNKSLRSEYKILSNGRSEKIFRFLINAERMTLPLSYLFDRKTHVYQRAGIPLFSQEFMPMNSIEVSRSARPKEKRVRINYKKTWSTLGKALARDDLESFHSECLEKIHQLNGAPDFSIMVRHLLESVYRCSYFLQGHEEGAIKLGMPSPRKIVFDLIRFQLWGLPGMDLLDDWCEPLQKEGISIFRYELPDLMKDLKPSH